MEKRLLLLLRYFNADASALRAHIYDAERRADPLDLRSSLALGLGEREAEGLPEEKEDDGGASALRRSPPRDPERVVDVELDERLPEVEEAWALCAIQAAYRPQMSGEGPAPKTGESDAVKVSNAL